MTLDLILPAYKPLPEWEKYAEMRIMRLKAAYEAETGQVLDLRLFVVPDCSPYGHGAEVRAFWETRPFETVYVGYARNKGKGGAIRAAMRLSTAPFVMYTDWDFPYTTDSMKDTLLELEDGADLVLADRRKETYLRVIPDRRKALSFLSHLFNRVLFCLPTVDTQGGLKGLSAKGRDAFLETRIDRFLFDTEFVALAVHRKLSVRVISAAIRPDIRLSDISPRTLLAELPGLCKIFYARWLS